MKLNQVVVEVLDADTADALTIAVNNFLASIGDATYVDLQYQLAGAPRASDSSLVLKYSAMIIYAK